MKKMIALLAVLFMVMVVGNAAALPTTGGALDTYFNTTNNWNIDVTDYEATDMPGYGLTTASTGMNMTFYMEGPAEYSFGIYSLTGGEEVEVFGTANTPQAQSVVWFDGGAATVNYFDDDGIAVPMVVGGGAFTGSTFGFYASYDNGSTVDTVYSDNSLNSNGDIRMLTYLADDASYVFAVDFVGNGTFDNMVVQAESIAPVPEPATMLLFGTGLAGLGIFSRKKKK